MLFNRKKYRFCVNCSNCALIPDGMVLCRKKGLRPADSHCIHFKYDPLKRIPAPGTVLLKPENPDFSL